MQAEEAAAGPIGQRILAGGVQEEGLLCRCACPLEHLAPSPPSEVSSNPPDLPWEPKDLTLPGGLGHQRRGFMWEVVNRLISDPPPLPHSSYSLPPWYNLHSMPRESSLNVLTIARFIHLDFWEDTEIYKRGLPSQFMASVSFEQNTLRLKLHLLTWVDEKVHTTSGLWRDPITRIMWIFHWAGFFFFLPSSLFPSSVPDHQCQVLERAAMIGRWLSKKKKSSTSSESLICPVSKNKLWKYELHFSCSVLF